MTVTHGVELAVIPVAAVSTVVALSFTPVEITTLTVALTAVIAALFTGVTQVITAVRTTRKIDENTAVTKDVQAAVEVVAGHVNSAATASTATIEALQKEITEMRAQMADRKEIAALLAQAQASNPGVTATATAAAEPLASAVEDSLEQINVNTAAIDQNTKKEPSK